MIICEKLTKSYRTKQGEVRALDDVSLELHPGEFIVVRGPSGCGKSTLLLTLGGMLRPTRGRVTMDGKALYDLDTRQRARFRAERVGFVFQMFHLVPYLSVLENVLLAAGTCPRTRAESLLDELGLKRRAHHKPGELSAGERQRAAVARALLNRPQLVLADEPTGNLDPENSAEVLEHLRTFREGGGTVVMATHSAAADRHADRIVDLRAGRISA